MMQQIRQSINPADTQSLDTGIDTAGVGDTQKINPSDTLNMDASDTQSIDQTDTQSVDLGDTQVLKDGDDVALDMPATETASPAATLELNLEEVNLEFEDEQEENSDIEISVVDDDEDQDIDLNLQTPEADDEAFSELTIEVENEDDATTQIELAKVFIDLGDSDGAKKILNEIIAEGSQDQKADAEALLASIK